jgi:hypothetical protein
MIPGFPSRSLAIRRTYKPARYAQLATGTGVQCVPQLSGAYGVSQQRSLVCSFRGVGE